MLVLAAKILLLLLATTAVTTASDPMVIRETRSNPGRGFVSSGPAPLSTNLTLRLGLRSNNISGLESTLYTVSEPSSSRYRQYLTADEVAAYVKPTDETITAVNAWLTAHNISSEAVTSAADVIQIVVSVEKANELLATQFSLFTYTATGNVTIRTLEYSIPASLQGHIDFVHPTTTFTRPTTASPKFTAITGKPNSRAESAVPASCSDVTTPLCLLEMYNMPTTQLSFDFTASLSVTGFTDQWANLADLEFLDEFRSDLTFIGAGLGVATLDGGTNDQTRTLAGVEANLDVQYAAGLLSRDSADFISVGPDTMDGVAGFLDLTTFIINMVFGERPLVISTSYSFDEEELSEDVASRLCAAYLQLGVLGTTVIFSSGDGGVAGGEASTCTTFVPTFPSTCPFVTSVGGTGGIPETAWPGSAGGFSNFFGAPGYQSTAVETYLEALGTRNEGLFQPGGRGFPDVSARATNVQIIWQGEVVGVLGTSASAPIFAAIVALLNQELAIEGKPQLGFLNPLLYSPGGRAALNDITAGDNPGCDTMGFPAAPGWDPVTGLGTPDYSKLQALVLSLPVPEPVMAEVVCDPTTDLCFEQFTSSFLAMTVGFALPPAGSEEFPDEALVYKLTRMAQSFPLPYGYAGVFLGAGNTGAQPEPVPAANWYVGLLPDAHLDPHHCQAEATMPEDDDMLHPVPTGQQISATFSPLTTETADRATFIFRCQQCNIITDYLTSADTVLMKPLLSFIFPDFLDSSMTLAVLSLGLAYTDSFMFDGNAARFENYAEMLEAAGLA